MFENIKLFCFYNIYDEFDEVIVRAKDLEEAYYMVGYDYVLEDVIDKPWGGEI